MPIMANSYGAGSFGTDTLAAAGGSGTSTATKQTAPTISPPASTTQQPTSTTTQTPSISPPVNATPTQAPSGGYTTDSSGVVTGGSAPASSPAPQAPASTPNYFSVPNALSASGGNLAAAGAAINAAQATPTISAPAAGAVAPGGQPQGSAATGGTPGAVTTPTGGPQILSEPLPATMTTALPAINPASLVNPPGPANAAPVISPPSMAIPTPGLAATGGAAAPAISPPTGSPYGSTQPTSPVTGGTSLGPNAGTPLSSIADVSSSLLSNPDPFQTQNVENAYNYLSGNLQEQAQEASSAADADAASRGLYYSSIPQMEKYGVGGIQENLGKGLGQLASNLLIPEAQLTQSGELGGLNAATTIGEQAMAGQNMNFEQALQEAELANMNVPTETGMFGGALGAMTPLVGEQGQYSTNPYSALGTYLDGNGSSSGGGVSAGGVLSDAAQGAALGSVIPGVGTAIGAIGGGLAGVLGGIF